MKIYFTSAKSIQKATILITFILMLCCGKASAYGVLTHEAIIDAAWEKNIEPLLKKKFPHSTPEDLSKAHAFAYGGAIMPDMGYFPFGSVFYTNLMHYVRSGDFVMNLLSEATNLNEYAFALGALSHYVSDDDGHPGAVNLSVGMVYPEVQKKFGDNITFEEDPVAHRRMEFGFDVLQVARGKYAPKTYHNFIGFEVSESLLKRAFLLTYGLELKSVFADLPLSVNTFRWSVKSFMPMVTNAAWISKKKAIETSQPGIKRKQFNYGISRAKYHHEWGREYHNPRMGAYAIAVMIKLFPKVWFVRILKFKAPPSTD